MGVIDDTVITNICIALKQSSRNKTLKELDKVKVWTAQNSLFDSIVKCIRNTLNILNSLQNEIHTNQLNISTIRQEFKNNNKNLKINITKLKKLKNPKILELIKSLNEFIQYYDNVFYIDNCFVINRLKVSGTSSNRQHDNVRQRKLSNVLPPFVQHDVQRNIRYDSLRATEKI